MDFDPTLLRAFVAVKETGGFTRAAQQLHLTQSAISHQIRRLEEQAGRPLLHRTTRKLTLTDDGEDFLRYAEQILQAQDAMVRRFQPSPVCGAVRFGVPENFMGERLPPLLCQFARAFPAIRLDVNVSMNLDLRAMIDAGELDLAVVISVPRSERGTVVRRTRLVWVAADIFTLPPDASVPLAFFPAPCVYRHAGVTALEQTTVKWHVVFTSPSQQGLRAAVLGGLAITVLTSDDLEPGMKIVDGQYGLPLLPSADFSLIWSDGGKTLAACEFGQLILDMPEQSSLPLLRSA
ncbi:LysR family transcriptional regulator [Collimonas pratensis]|uniref:Bacterial regulatory helix-turn-helix, lysR family protein n=1 Tax=Collimonas pratensis TaxID=279113 RepID=A0A127Q4M2_9BURK|nr:LysR family transcriptional regulator [Collimonas pratensis]AMP05028.1 bacterial regulatory helix-turn-helix, lysR family protein [Collimonas pratensis]AMP14939.1 bacterial regulatory helix-turn-helix, lysR family protein [Collimonas pratensis]